MPKRAAAPAGATKHYKCSDIVAPAASEPVKIPKKALCLAYLMRCSLIELEALNLYGETCLHSTISELYNRQGLIFKRKPEAHQHRHRGTTHFARYTLAPDSRKAAAALLAHYGVTAEEVAA